MNIKEADHILDARGLACPMPIVKTKQQIDKLNSGEILVVLATDKGSKADIIAWAKSSGQEYLGTIEEENEMQHYIKKNIADEEVDTSVEFIKIATLEDLQNGIDKDNIVLVDVRESDEYALKHIPNAISIPLGDITERMTELNQEDQIYLICHSGNRSGHAAKILMKQGYNNVLNVVPGMNKWAGLSASLKGGQ